MNLNFFKKHLKLLLVFILPLSVYFLTYPRAIGFIDSGLMAAAVSDLGIALPTGFPAYTIIAHLFSLLPLGSFTDRLYLVSYLSAAFLLIVLWFFIKNIISSGNKRVVELASMFSCFSLAFSYQFWSSAINIETFTLTNLVIFLLLFILIFIDKSLKENSKVFKKNEKIIIFSFFIILGFAFGLSPTVVILFPALLIWGYFNKKYLKGNLRLIMSGFFITSLILVLEYLFLIIRASAHPFINFGSPTSVLALIALMTGKGFLSNNSEISKGIIAFSGLTLNINIILISFKVYLSILFHQFNPLLLPVIVYGAVRLFKNKLLFLMLSSLFLSNLLFTVFYISGNQEYWSLTGWIIMTLLLALGVYSILEKLQLNVKNNSRFYLLLVLFSLLPLIFWYPKLDRSGMSLTKDFIFNMYQGVLPNSVIIGGGNIFEGQTSYAREVLSYRKDVTPISGNFFYDFSWYRENISKISGLKVSEKTVKIILKTDKNNEENIIASLVNDNQGKQFYLANSFVRFYMQNIANDCINGKCGFRGYNLIPHGLLYKVVPDKNSDKPNDKLFEFKINKNDFYFLEQLVNLQVKSIEDEYPSAYQNIGDYYLSKKNFNKALYFYKKSLRLNQEDNSGVIVRLAVVYQNLKNIELAKLYYEEAVNLLPDNLELKNKYSDFLSQNNQQAVTREINKTKSQPQISIKNYVSNLGFNIDYLSNWKLSESQESLSIKSPDDSLSIKIIPFSYENQTIFDFLRERTDSFGTLINQGNALVPNFDKAYLRIWNDKGIIKYQFFFIKGKQGLEVIVFPANSTLMKIFDQMIGTIKFN